MITSTTCIFPSKCQPGSPVYVGLKTCTACTNMCVCWLCHHCKYYVSKQINVLFQPSFRWRRWNHSDPRSTQYSGRPTMHLPSGMHRRVEQPMSTQVLSRDSHLVSLGYRTVYIQRHGQSSESLGHQLSYGEY